MQSAKIEMETKKRGAEGFAAREIPKAKAERNRLVQQAVAYENTLKARAAAEMLNSALESMAKAITHKSNPYLVGVLDSHYDGGTERGGATAFVPCRIR